MHAKKLIINPLNKLAPKCMLCNVEMKIMSIKHLSEKWPSFIRPTDIPVSEVQVSCPTLKCPMLEQTILVAGYIDMPEKWGKE